MKFFFFSLLMKWKFFFSETKVNIEIKKSSRTTQEFRNNRSENYSLKVQFRAENYSVWIIEEEQWESKKKGIISWSEN